jgi:hypothetical protein
MQFKAGRIPSPLTMLMRGLSEVRCAKLQGIAKVPVNDIRGNLGPSAHMGNLRTYRDLATFAW